MGKLRIAAIVLGTLALVPCSARLSAQGGSCRDPWINSAFNQVFHRAPQGYGTAGECNIDLYGGGRWVSFQDLVSKVQGSKYCQDAWIGEAYVLAFRRAPQGNECSPSNYGGGRWTSFDDLVAKVQQYQRQLVSTPYRPYTPPPVYTPPPPQAVAVVSAMGAKCLDAEGGRSGRGVHLIGFACNGNVNQRFQFNANGTITQNGLCVDAYSGLGRNGDQIQLWDCDGGPNQRWGIVNNQLVGINNKCVDLKGGQGWWFGNQPAILWDCNGQINQHWFKGLVVSSTQVRGGSPVQPGALLTLRPINAAGVIAAGGGNVIAAGGGNVIAAGGGNVIAAGGGNVIAAGGGNMIVPVSQ